MSPRSVHRGAQSWYPLVTAAWRQHCEEIHARRFEEPAVNRQSGANHGARLTNEACEKVDADHYLIDGQAIDFPVIVADTSMLIKAAVLRVYQKHRNALCRRRVVGD